MRHSMDVDPACKCWGCKRINQEELEEEQKEGEQ